MLATFLPGAFFAAFSSDDETPMPTPTMTVDPNLVTPGPLGFIVVVILVIAVILLIWDMNRRVRRVRYRGEVREELDAEQAAMDAAASTDSPETRDQKNPPA